MLLLVWLSVMLGIESRIVYVGSFTGSQVSIFQFTAPGTPLRLLQQQKTGNGPTWLHRHGSLLFATNEVDGFVENFSIGPGGTSLVPLSRRSSLGEAPTHLTISQNGKYLLVANYNSGSVAVFAVGSRDGVIGANTSFSAHSGSGPNRDRQSGPHAHQILLSSDNTKAFSPDLGSDRVYQYHFDAETGKLTPNSVPYWSSSPGDGPRHLVIHPSQRFAYLACELSSTLVVLAYSEASGTLSTLQRVPLPSPQGSSIPNYPAEILLNPGGNTLYVTNRGNDTVSVFSVAPSDGKVALVEVVPVGGSYPRGFLLDDKDGVAFAGNQNSGTVTSMSIGLEGKLTSGVVVASQLNTPVSFELYE